MNITANKVTIKEFTLTGSGGDWPDAGLKIESSGNTISNNNVSNNHVGIYFSSSSNNTLSNNNVSNNEDGIYFRSSGNNTITNNTASNNEGYGIQLFESSNNTLSNNTASNHEGGVYMGYSSGIYLDYSCDNTITDNNASNNGVGIKLQDSCNNTLSNNNASNSRYGIYLRYSTNNTLSSNNVSNNEDGIYFRYSSNNTLSNNKASNNEGYGIHLLDSSNNTLSNNKASNNHVGIYLLSSSNNTLKNNTMSGNSYNFGVYGTSLSDYLQKIDSSNTVDGRPVYYWVNQKDVEIPEDAGFVGIINSTNVTVKDLRLKNNDKGILFVATSNSRIENVSVSDNFDGIALGGSSNNTLTNNNVSNNHEYGFGFWSSSNNNTITNNNVSNNGNNGIYLSSSSNNLIYLNDFINNNFYSSDSDNVWNSPQPITYTYNGSEYVNFLGNYWSDYSGLDKNGDGVGEISYNIDGGVDSYPLIKPFDTYLQVPSTTESVMNETFSSTQNLLETIVSQKALLNATITGDLNGTINFTELEYVCINSGSFAGKGFTKGNWSANIEGVPREGEWKGVLFKKPEERKIYLKGVLSGGLKGIVEGYLTESVNGSNVYDQFQATCTANQIGNDIIFAKLDLNGTADYTESNEYSSELYALQTSIEGEASGYYNGSLSIILTHVRINNDANPYYGEGFSIVTYTSEYGSGKGWTYNKLLSPNISQLNGLFNDPVKGIIKGELDESSSPRTLSIEIERIDLGLPPTADLEVRTWGPSRVSPGQTVDYIVEVRNNGVKEAENITIIFVPSFLTNHVSTTSRGVYDDVIHIVRWDVRTIAPKTTSYLVSQEEIFWGLEQGLPLEFRAYILPREEADQALYHHTPGLNKITKEIANFIWTIIKGFLPSPLGTTIGVTEQVPQDALTAVKVRLRQKCNTASEIGFEYCAEVKELIENMENDHDYLEKNYPGKSFPEVIQEIKQEYKQQYGQNPLPDQDQEGQISQITPAHDPNIKYGPEGFVLPGQKLDYRVEYENEGEGSAFGVYFTDTLDEDLNASTLEIGSVIDVQSGEQIAPPGNYNPDTRTITWFVGEVGPGEGGYANYSINLSSDAEEGTEVINYATVYFPSVPEETRTNGIVSTVDITPPRYSNVNQSKSIVEAGEYVDVSAYWQDGVQLNYTWLETNESGEWLNTSYLKHLSGRGWSNYTLRTTQGGTICWRIHANDTAGNENVTPISCFEVVSATTESEPSPSAGGGGGGGGGGGLPPAPPLVAPSEFSESLTRYFSQNEEEIMEMPAKLLDMGISEIGALYDRSTTLRVTVSKVSSLPSNIQAPSGEVYTYFEVVFTDYYTSAKVEPSGHVNFRVSKDWLGGADESDVKFLKWENGKWSELSSEMVDEDSDYYYFEVSLESFSLFAVAKERASIPSMPSMPEGTPTETTTPTPTATTTPQPTATTTPFWQQSTVIIGIAAIILAAIVILAYVVRRE